MQNNRSDQAAGRGHSRSWFVGFEVRAYLWRCQYRRLTSLFKNWMPEYKSKAQNEKDRAVAAAQEKETRLRDAYVVIPLGDEAKTTTCPICKEVLSPEFLEEDEEWVFKNAIGVNGKVRAFTSQ